MDMLPQPGEGFSLKRLVDEMRRKYYLWAMEFAGGNKNEAGRLLDVTGQAVSAYLEKHSLEDNM